MDLRLFVTLPLLIALSEVALGQFQEPAASAGGSQETNRKSWLEFDACPVFVIDSLDIPAQENGIIAKLDVRVNQDIEVGQLLGHLDRTAAMLEESLAAKQAQVALAMAADDGDLKFAKLLVEEASIAFESYEQINSRGSATDAEMRSKGLSVTQAELKVQHAIQTIEQLKLKARLAQASVVAASERLNRLKFIAPFSGSIADVFRHEGEWVPMGQPVVRLIRLDELRVDVYIPIQDVDMASLVSAPVIVTARRAGMDAVHFSGRVTHYDPSVSSTGEVRVHATIQNQRVNGHWLLLPGMTAHLKIQPPSGPHAASLLRRNVERR
ncbi:MAG: HlyD family efflux transporter periplasmic adaptor subunit [Pirellulaceae bacterium]|nr:HlyD family efflux transporter periplasmic adaptor subunit [Pirellulaceae bacterium]